MQGVACIRAPPSGVTENSAGGDAVSPHSDKKQQHLHYTLLSININECIVCYLNVSRLDAAV